MDNLLRYAHVAEPCNACGGQFITTLLDVLMEHRVRKEWTPPRPCSACAGNSSPFAATINPKLLEQLDRAWQAVRAEAESAGYELVVGVHPEAREQSRSV